jgi:hypothetical protein
MKRGGGHASQQGNLIEGAKVSLRKRNGKQKQTKAPQTSKGRNEKQTLWFGDRCRT